MINYISDLKNISEQNLSGFFIGWPSPPNEKTLIEILKGSYKYILAMDEGNVVGFINCLSDGVLSAYIPFLEVLPSHQGRGIGKELVRRMKSELAHLYMIDVLCDEDVIPFYEKLGMMTATGVCVRNYDNQSGASLS